MNVSREQRFTSSLLRHLEEYILHLCLDILCVLVKENVDTVVARESLKDASYDFASYHIAMGKFFYKN